MCSQHRSLSVFEKEIPVFVEERIFGTARHE